VMSNKHTVKTRKSKDTGKTYCSPECARKAEPTGIMDYVRLKDQTGKQEFCANAECKKPLCPFCTGSGIMRYTMEWVRQCITCQGTGMKNWKKARGE